MQKKINYINIIFDFNGTLLDDVDLTLSIEQEMMAKSGLPKITKEEYLNNFFFPVRDYYIKAGFDLNKVDFEELTKYFMDQYDKREEKEASLFNNLIPTLKALKDYGYKLYVLSASEKNRLIKQLKYRGIEEFFDGIVGSEDDFASGKAEYGKAFAKEHNLLPENTIMIGDTDHDALVADYIGIPVILFRGGHNSYERLKKSKRKILKNYDEIYNYFIG